jgi:hypothetical protein
MRWEGHAAHIREMRNACIVLSEILKERYCKVDMH